MNSFLMHKFPLCLATPIYGHHRNTPYKDIFYRLLVLGHRNLIKNMKQTAVINIVKNRILLT